ncbi:MAG: OsmC family protein [Saprospiraceae bacterium]|nr:OsmC family protein [Saprospiraceae bacterium]
MKVTLKRVSPENYEGENARGQHIELSGTREGVGPMESVLMAGASCASIDLELILAKMKQELLHLEVHIEGKRAEDQVPKVFTGIHLHFILIGNVAPEKAEKAIELSTRKYCSVLSMLEKSATITTSFEIRD